MEKNVSFIVFTPSGCDKSDILKVSKYIRQFDSDLSNSLAESEYIK